MNKHWLHTVCVVALFASTASPVEASDNEHTCHGNIETGGRQITKAGVTYKLSYVVSGSKAAIKFAGREFEATAETGKSWKGLWIKRIDKDIYFSFLPDDGGTIKFEFEANQWYSGNC